jgi:hypothetical protein
MTDQAMSPLRRRMIEDRTIRKFAAKTQHDYLQRVKNLAACRGIHAAAGHSLRNMPIITDFAITRAGWSRLVRRSLKSEGGRRNPSSWRS